MTYNNFFLIVCGPTGAGKTDLSYEIAGRYPVEIINCDIGQFYEPCSIGTAKPAWKGHVTVHHGFDSITQPGHCTVVEYRNMLQGLMQRIWARGALPVIVGGSLFYIKTLFFPPLLTTSESGACNEEMRTLSSEDLWSRLYALDPQRALALHKNDRYRIERALVICKSGTTPSALKPAFLPLADFYLTFVWSDRNVLYDRINKRAEIMMHQGWVEEVAGLTESWKKFLREKKIIGYSEILSCLQQSVVGGSTLMQACHACKHDPVLLKSIQKRTRNYAKRQITFWQSLKRDLYKHGQKHNIYELNTATCSVPDYLDTLQHIMNKVCKKNSTERSTHNEQ